MSALGKRKADGAAQAQQQAAAAKQIVEVSPPATNLVEFTPLGAGQEVGRSCMILKYQ